jgi:xanthine/uracil permease
MAFIIASIPQYALGAAAMVMFGTVALMGVRILSQVDYIVTVDSHNTIIKDGAVLVEQGKIVQLGKVSELLAQHANVPLKAVSFKKTLIVLLLGIEYLSN